MPSTQTHNARRLARAEQALGPASPAIADRSPWDWFADCCPCGLPPANARRIPAPGPPSGRPRATGGPGCCSAAGPPARPAPPPSWSGTGPSPAGPPHRPRRPHGRRLPRYDDPGARAASSPSPRPGTGPGTSPPSDGSPGPTGRSPSASRPTSPSGPAASSSIASGATSSAPGSTRSGCGRPSFCASGSAHQPRAVVTTTPRPIKLLTRILEDPTTRLSKETTFANARHLAPEFVTEIAAMYQGTRLGDQELNGRDRRHLGRRPLPELQRGPARPGEGRVRPRPARPPGHRLRPLPTRRGPLVPGPRARRRLAQQRPPDHHRLRRLLRR